MAVKITQVEKDRMLVQINSSRDKLSRAYAVAQDHSSQAWAQQAEAQMYTMLWKSYWVRYALLCAA
ncbi:MAG: hypothetical protein A2Y38_12960 [Spirochaetes bacterium GWB1_59_5]|nr:MAG: hypothetical protein A2Y38_12960 [Spirochaetes bacterium GWB1_59_5]